MWLYMVLRYFRYFQNSCVHYAMYSLSGTWVSRYVDAEEVGIDLQGFSRKMTIPFTPAFRVTQKTSRDGRH